MSVFSRLCKLHIIQNLQEKAQLRYIEDQNNQNLSNLKRRGNGRVFFYFKDFYYGEKYFVLPENDQNFIHGMLRSGGRENFEMVKKKSGLVRFAIFPLLLLQHGPMLLLYIS